MALLGLNRRKFACSSFLPCLVSALQVEKTKGIVSQCKIRGSVVTERAGVACIDVGPVSFYFLSGGGVGGGCSVGGIRGGGIRVCHVWLLFFLGGGRGLNLLGETTVFLPPLRWWW